jgi:hypothetical protein
MSKKSDKKSDLNSSLGKDNTFERVGGRIRNDSAPKKPLPPPDPRDRNTESRIKSTCDGDE